MIIVGLALMMINSFDFRTATIMLTLVIYNNIFPGNLPDYRLILINLFFYRFQAKLTL